MTRDSLNNKSKGTKSKRRGAGQRKNIKKSRRSQDKTNNYDQIKDVPQIIKNEIEHETMVNLSWKSINGAVPNIMIEEIKRLASSSKHKNLEQQNYYCKHMTTVATRNEKESHLQFKQESSTSSKSN